VFEFCPNISKDLFISWRKCLRYSNLSEGVCFYCHVPQGPKDALHPKFIRNAATTCEFRDIVAPLVYGLLTHGAHTTTIQAEFPRLNATTPPLALEWINSRPIKGHVTNLSALFLWYCSQYL
jgi:hypothetical protein